MEITTLLFIAGFGLATGLLVLLAFLMFSRQSEARYTNVMMLKIRKASRIHTLPMRLSAYERCILLLERISPQSLIPRIESSGMNVREYQVRLVHEIRAEFDHNLSQQLYIGEEGWAQVIRSKEELIGLIHKCASSLPPNAAGVDLAKKIIEETNRLSQHPAEIALKTLKKEVRTLF